MAKKVELSDSGKITITIDSCILFTIHDTIMIVINNINLYIYIYISAIDHSWNN